MFKNLSAVLKAENITHEEYGLILGISEKSVDNKIAGKTDFTYTEFKKTTLLLRKYNAEFLFQEEEKTQAPQ